MQSRQGVVHFRIKGKRDKIRFVPVHPMAQRLIGEYLAAVKHGGAVSHESLDGPLFRPVKNNRTGKLDRQLDPGSVYRNIVPKYGRDDRHQRRGERTVRPFAARDGRDQCALARGRHRQGAGMARPRERLHYPPLRPAQEQARGQPDFHVKY